MKQFFNFQKQQILENALNRILISNTMMAAVC